VSLQRFAATMGRATVSACDPHPLDPRGNTRPRRPELELRFSEQSHTSWSGLPRRDSSQRCTRFDDRTRPNYPPGLPRTTQSKPQGRCSRTESAHPLKLRPPRLHPVAFPRRTPHNSAFLESDRVRLRVRPVGSTRNVNVITHISLNPPDDCHSTAAPLK